ncbi:MAG: diguanylate cyclase domain-containing protein [Anaeroplasma sp.]
MPTLAEILRLEKTQSSIKKIDLYLSSTIKLSDEYMTAISYKALVLHNIGKTNEGLRVLFSYIPDFKIMGHKAVIAVCDALIEIYIDEYRFDQVEKYINIKKNYLPMSKMNLYIKDKIRLYLAMKDTKRAKEELINYLQDDLTKEEEIYGLEELSSIYFQEHQYDKFLELAAKLESFYQTNLAIDKLAVLDINKLKVAYYKGNYIKVVTAADKIIEENNKPQYLLSIATIVIKSYIQLNDLKKAGIYESNYEEFVSIDNLSESIEFCNAALELYTKLNSLVSVKDYENRLRELQAVKAPKIPKKKTKKEEIIINNSYQATAIVPENDVYNPVSGFLNPKNEIEKPQGQIVVKPINLKVINVSEAYEKLANIFKTLNNIDVNLKFREIFRLAMIELSKIYSIEEAYILYFNKRYLGLHYKKERVYDKRLEFDDISNTISYATMEYDKELFLDQSERLYLKDIVTNKDYESEIYAMGIPLHDAIQTIGSIVFFSSNPFLDTEIVYESLKLISEMINLRLILALKQDENDFNNRKLYFIRDEMSSGIKEEIEGFIHFSSQAVNILGVLEDLSLNDFLLNMNSNDAANYKKIHDEIYSLMKENVEIEYDYNKNGKCVHIKERFYPMYTDGNIYILSLIDDITEQTKNKNALIDLAYKNPISKLATDVKLIVDLKDNYLSGKLSLCVCNINDFSIYKELYGNNFSKQLIYTLGKELTEVFSDDFHVNVYHLEVDKFAILFLDANDKRLIDSKLKKAFEIVSNNIYRINSRVTISFNAGVYRLSKNIKIKDVNDILKYAEEALYDAEDMDTNGSCISHYDSESAKERFKINSIITHISEAIDSGMLGLTYQQIVNLNKLDVYGYNIKINLDNYEIDYNLMEMVIKRRRLTNRIEKYTIMNTFKELKQLNDLTGGYIYCFINISEEVLDEVFFDFVLTQLNFFKIKANYIVFCCENVNNPCLLKLREKGFKLCSYNILDLYGNLCDYFMYDYHRVGKDSINEIRELCNLHNSICILGGMNTIDDINMAKEKNYDLIYGSYYKKSLRMKGILKKVKN